VVRVGLLRPEEDSGHPRAPTALRRGPVLDDPGVAVAVRVVDVEAAVALIGRVKSHREQALLLSLGPDESRDVEEHSRAAVPGDPQDASFLLDHVEGGLALGLGDEHRSLELADLLQGDVPIAVADRRSVVRAGGGRGGRGHDRWARHLRLVLLAARGGEEGQGDEREDQGGADHGGKP